ncbi:MAG: hypothetical protein IJ751_05990 [Oscillospiraceae bacterium]|nr:hypothetical protein [Oscillospiraceae bacterium]
MADRRAGGASEGDVLSLQLLSPLREETATLNALLPPLLRRGTARLPDREQLDHELDDLYGASITPTVRRRGEVQCLGFVARLPRQELVPEGISSVERGAALLGELLLHPATRSARLRQDDVYATRAALTQALRDRRREEDAYVRRRLLEEMCRGEAAAVCPWGVEKRSEKVTVARLFSQYQTLLERADVELFYCGAETPQRLELAVREALMGLPRASARYDLVTETARPAYDGPREITENTAGRELAALGYRLGFGRDDALFPALLVVVHALKSQLKETAQVTLLEGKGILRIVCPRENRPQVEEAVSRLKWNDIDASEVLSARAGVRDALLDALDDAAKLEALWLADCAAGEVFAPESLLAQVEQVTDGQFYAAAQELLLDTAFALVRPQEGGDRR